MRQISRGLVGAGTVGLVHDEHVGDLDDAGLDRLDVVAEAGDGHQANGIDDADDVHLLLTHANGLDQHDVRPEGVEHVHDPRGRARETAGVPATSHRPDEDALIEETLPHSDAVAEDGAAAERARWIDRDDRDPGRSLAVQTGESIHERRLAATRRARDPDRLRVTGLRVELAHRLGGAGLVVLHDRNETRDRSLVARSRTSEQIAGRGRGHQSTRRSWRAITIRWTSLVPSPISMRRTSRRWRSIGKS